MHILHALVCNTFSNVYSPSDIYSALSVSCFVIHYRSGELWENQKLESCFQHFLSTETVTSFLADLVRLASMLLLTDNIPPEVLASKSAPDDMCLLLCRDMTLGFGYVVITAVN